MDNFFNDMDLFELEEKLNLRISGDNFIELETLVTSLTTLSSIVKSASDDLFPNSDIKVVIDKIEPGNSITTYLSVIGQVVAIGAGSITIIKAIVHLFKLRKNLKGEKPKNITTNVNDSEKVIVQNHIGEKSEVNVDILKIYLTNPSIEQNLNKLGKDLTSTNRSSFEFKETTKNTFEEAEHVSFDKNDIEALTKKIPVNEIDVDPEEVLTREILYLVTAKYNSNAMWDFIMSDGQRISAQIHDISFLNGINSGRIGTTGKTELEVELLTVINKGLTTSDRKIKTRYYIKKVHKLRNPYDGEQPTLFDFDFGRR